MTKKMHAWSLAALPLAIGMASFSGSANAVNFNLGEVQGQFDSQLSIGASMSTQGADKRFISVNNGGEAAARTSDDGRQNYEAGDVFSKIFRGVHDLELRYGDSGAFVRGKYWYDFETKDGDQRFYNIDDSGRDPLQKASGVALLDAFVYHNYFIGNNPGNVRLGRQVVSWGESTFIQNSINSINPIDVAALRRPGAEIKEGLLPVEMLYMSQGLTDNLSMEAFYQLKWRLPCWITAVLSLGLILWPKVVLIDWCSLVRIFRKASNLTSQPSFVAKKTATPVMMVSSVLRSAILHLS